MVENTPLLANYPKKIFKTSTNKGKKIGNKIPPKFWKKNYDDDNNGFSHNGQYIAIGSPIKTEKTVNPSI